MSAGVSVVHSLPRQSSVADRLPSWQTALCMDDDREWIKTVEKSSPVPEDATLPTPDDLAYIVMRYLHARTGLTNMRVYVCVW